jgi:hypothetical protein
MQHSPASQGNGKLHNANAEHRPPHLPLPEQFQNESIGNGYRHNVDQQRKQPSGLRRRSYQYAP